MGELTSLPLIKAYNYVIYRLNKMIFCKNKRVDQLTKKIFFHHELAILNAELDGS